MEGESVMGIASERLKRRLKILLPLAGVVALIIFGMIMFDQIVATVGVFIGRANLERILSYPLPRGYWHIAILNIIIVALFLALIPVRLKSSWRAHGAYLGFMVSMFSEMFGFPLTVYLLTTAGYQFIEPEFIRYVWTIGHIVGSPIVIIGLFLLFLGWKEIFLERDDRLVTEGIYSIVRHPQYLGIILVTLGMLLVWPTLPTLIMWPILTALYYRQARLEERTLLLKFGKEFEEYTKRTPMFIPKIRLPKVRTYRSDFIKP